MKHVKQLLLSISLLGFCDPIVLAKDHSNSKKEKHHVNTCQCENHKKIRKCLPGLYTGSVIFVGTPPTTEAVTYLFHKDGSFEEITRLETYKLVTTPVIPQIETFNDQETATLGQWDVDCDGTITVTFIQYRQAGLTGGLPALLGLTNTEIPSLPNYALLATGKFVLEGNSLTAIQGTVKVGATDVNWNVDNQTALYPFLQVSQAHLKRVTMQQIIESINKS
jgi:hypothetical protein